MSYSPSLYASAYYWFHVVSALPEAIMIGKTCLITGANSGIGKETARGLAELGARVVLVCRNPQRGESAKEDIVRRSGSGSVDLLLADLSSLQEVRGLAERVVERYERLHVLVNNAGLFSLRRSRTVDGFETTFAVNHLAPFLLTNLLLELLKKSAPSRIVNVSSVSHYGGHIDFEKLRAGRAGSGMGGYSNSKLALVLFTYELARRLRGTGVTVNCLHPGAVATNIWRVPTWLTRLFMASAEKGAETPIFLASAPEIEMATGKYFDSGEAKKSSEESYDNQVAERLWHLSAELVGLGR